MRQVYRLLRFSTLTDEYVVIQNDLFMRTDEYARPDYKLTGCVEFIAEEKDMNIFPLDAELEVK